MNNEVHFDLPRVHPLLAAASAGAATAIAQVVLLRELHVSAAAPAFLLGPFFAAWLLAGGAAAACPWTRKIDRVAPLAVVAAVLCACAWLAARAWPWLAGASPGMPAALGVVSAAALVVTVLPSAALGALFRALAGRAPPARVYAAEALGFLAGGLLQPALAGAGVGPLGCVTLAMALLLVAAFGPLALLLGAVSFLPVLERADARLLGLQWPGAQTVVGLATRASSVHVVTAEGGRPQVYIDGRLAFSPGESEATEPAVHVPLLAHPAPRRVLLVGRLLDGTLAEVLRQPVERVVACDLDPELPARLAARLPAQASALADPRVWVAGTDARELLESSPERYDCVLLLGAGPDGGSLGRLGGRRFFALLARRLAPGGMAFLRLPVGSGFLGEQERQLGGSLSSAFALAFPGATILCAEPLILAGGAPPADAATLARRLRERLRGLSYLEPEHLEELAGPEGIHARLMWLDPAGQASGPADLLARWIALSGCRAEDDLDAAGMRRVLARSLAVHAPAAGRAFERIARAGWMPWAALAALAVMLAGRRRALGGGAVPVLTTGVASMAGTLLLMIAWQVRFGRLLGEVGALSGVVMAGAAAGAWLAAGPRLAPARALGTADALLAAGLAALAACLTGPAPPAALLLAGLALLGLATGFQFAAATRLTGGEAGPLYGLDLAGAAFGAAVATTVLLPAWGFGGAFLLLAAVKAGSVVVLLQEALARSR